MSADLLALLDQLNEARAKATPGEWEQHPADGEYVIGDVSDGGENYLDVADTYSFGGRDSGYADAACIVAEHNALPKLTAALRAVLAVHQRFTDPYGVTRLWCQHDPDDTWPCPTMQAITAALTPEQVQP